MKIAGIDDHSDLAETNPGNDISMCMLCRMTDRNSRSLWLQQTTSFGAWENEGTNYFFGSTTVFVKSLTKENIGSAMEAMVTVEDGMWLTVYGT